MLKVGGRSATIVPQGVLFGSSKAHQSLRKTLVEDNQLEAVINLPSGVFKPYAGVATAILIFTKGGQTDEVWFYDLQMMATAWMTSVTQLKTTTCRICWQAGSITVLYAGCRLITLWVRN